MIVKRKHLISLICLVSFALTACVDEHDGECNPRDYQDMQRSDLSDTDDAGSGSAGRDEVSERAD